MPTLNSLLNESRWRPVWRVLFVVLLGLVSWFAFTPVPPGPDFTGADKLNHILAFGALVVPALLCARKSARNTVLAMSGLVLYGAFIEIMQSQLPTRHGAWADLAADVAGITLGALALTLLRRASSRRSRV